MADEKEPSGRERKECSHLHPFNVNLCNNAARGFQTLLLFACVQMLFGYLWACACPVPIWIFSPAQLSGHA